MKSFLDKYNRLPPNFQPEVRYDTLIRNVILNELISLMGGILIDIDIELKLKISRIDYLESKLS